MTHGYIRITDNNRFVVEPTAMDDLGLISAATSALIHPNFASTLEAANRLGERINQQLERLTVADRYRWLTLYHRTALLMKRDRNPDLPEVVTVRQMVAAATSSSSFADHLDNLSAMEEDAMLRAARRLAAYMTLMVPVLCFLVAEDAEIHDNKMVLSIHDGPLNGVLRDELAIVTAPLHRAVVEHGLSLHIVNYGLRQLLVALAASPALDDGGAIEAYLDQLVQFVLLRKTTSDRIARIGEMLRLPSTRVMLRRADGQWDLRLLETIADDGTIAEQDEAIEFLLASDYSPRKLRAPEDEILRLEEPLILLARPTIDQTVIIHNITSLRNLGIGELACVTFADSQVSDLRQCLNELAARTIG